MDTSYKTVVKGEASESSSEEEEVEEKTVTKLHPSQAVVVEGEATESDEEEIDTSINKHRSIPPIKMSQSSHSSIDSVDDNGSISSSSPKHTGLMRSKYDSILNRKLWESNLSLCTNLNGLVSQSYLSAAKELSNYCQQLTKSHTAIQDVSHNMRLMTNDLFHLDDRIDIISTCKLLPDIKHPSKDEANFPVSGQ